MASPSQGQVSLAWLAGRPAVTSVILGARHALRAHPRIAGTSVTPPRDTRKPAADITWGVLKLHIGMRRPRPIDPEWCASGATVI
jgi:hypothetical protein